MIHTKLFQRFSCEPVTATIGAEISNISLTGAGEHLFSELREALTIHKVLFIRSQHLSIDQLCEFSKGFGALMRVPYIQPLDNHPDVIAVLKEADEINMGVFGGDWHSDFSFLDRPPLASLLYSVQIPPVGGDTLWVNMAAAYAALPEETKDFLGDKSAIHTGAPYGLANAPDVATQFTGSIKIDRNNPEADVETWHPAVCRHPDSGEAMLFISPTYTFRFGDMSVQQSQPILRDLYSHCTKPEFTCRFRWTPHTIAIWDNRCTMHYAVNDYDGYRRLLYRTTIEGHQPLKFEPSRTS